MGAVICCLVDGDIVVLDLCGSIIWRVGTFLIVQCKIFFFLIFFILLQCGTGGPVFAGACISYVLPSQVKAVYSSSFLYSEKLILFLYQVQLLFSFTFVFSSYHVRNRQTKWRIQLAFLVYLMHKSEA